PPSIATRIVTLTPLPTRRSSDLQGVAATAGVAQRDPIAAAADRRGPGLSPGTSPRRPASTGRPARRCPPRAGSDRKPDRLRHGQDRKSTRLNSSHLGISYAVFCL